MLFQFRDESLKTVRKNEKGENTLSNVLRSITEDSENHETVLNPIKYSYCCYCGKKFVKKDLKNIDRSQANHWLSLLEGKPYASPLETEIYFCKTCISLLKSNRISKFSLCKGWVFRDSTPKQLEGLNKYETMLISLRLPCVYVCRFKGNYGQYASIGTPISFTNPVAKLVEVLPRDPNLVFKHILRNVQKLFLMGID